MGRTILPSRGGGGVPGLSSRGIFLSYRRDDAAPYARLLQFQLRERFPDARVFMDLDSIEPGLDFAEVIHEAVDSCAVLVALIGRQWATLTDEEGHRRLDNPDDYVRFEVEAALGRGVRVIPVLVDGARPLRQQQLPSELQRLARLNALELSYGRYEYDADRLLDLIQRVLAATTSTGTVPHPPPTADAEVLAGLSLDETNPITRVSQRGEVAGSIGSPIQTWDRVSRGITGVTELISRTLGPMGRTCVLTDQSGNDIEAPDSTTIVEHFVPDDPHHALGASYVRTMVGDQHHGAHDGAATAAVLAHAMVARTVDALHSGANPMSLKRGITAAVAQVSEELSQIASDLMNKEQIAALATTSDGDPATGQIVAEAIDKIGREGAIAVERSNTSDLKLELAEGMRFANGYISPHFVTNSERMEAVLEDPYILLTDAKISAGKDLQPLLAKVVKSGQPLAVIARDVDGDALATLIASNLRGPSKFVAVKAPGTGDQRKAMLADIAIQAGGYVVAEETQLTLENVDLDKLGRARKVVATRDETMIVDSAGDGAQLAGRVNQIKREYDELANTDLDYERGRLMERLAKLAGGVALIKVGAGSEDEFHQRKQRMEDAVLISRAAIETGILPGGGAALVDVQRRLASHDRLTSGTIPSTADEATGMAIVVDSLAEPLKQIVTNAGQDPAALAGFLASWQPGTGIDVLAGVPKDMLKAGIIDTVAVVSKAVTNAANLTQRLLLLT
jgi:chaperonin GroEL